MGSVLANSLLSLLGELAGGGSVALAVGVVNRQHVVCDLDTIFSLSKEKHKQIYKLHHCRV